uniref:Uncharacterized protein n=1 Tax=Anopheles atroparvus TaxID=41427 RepID=A0A182JIL8_ANOAO
MIRNHKYLPDILFQHTKSDSKGTYLKSKLRFLWCVESLVFGGGIPDDVPLPAFGAVRPWTAGILAVDSPRPLLLLLLRLSLGLWNRGGKVALPKPLDVVVLLLLLLLVPLVEPFALAADGNVVLDTVAPEGGLIASGTLLFGGWSATAGRWVLMFSSSLDADLAPEPATPLVRTVPLPVSCFPPFATGAVPMTPPPPLAFPFTVDDDADEDEDDLNAENTEFIFGVTPDAGVSPD